MIELKTAKYKGIEFLFESMPTTGGNRLIKHNYPGSDKQSIERQGKAPQSFSITIIIPNDDYYQKRDALLQILNDGEKGVLTHPTLGDIDNVITGIYTLTESISEIGRAKLVVPFEIDNATGIPVQSGNLVSQVQEKSIVLNEQLIFDLADSYDVSLNFPANFTDALENITNIGFEFDLVSQLADPITGKASDFTKLVNSFIDNAGDLIQVPSDLSSSISGLFQSLVNLYLTPETSIAVLKGLFTFGDNDPIIRTNTVSRTQRKRNRDTVRANVKTQALSHAYLAAAQIDYETTDELDLVQTELETQYLDIRNNQLMTNEGLEALDILRVQGQKTLDNARVTTRSIITIETQRKPLSVLVFDYYGSTELVDIIAELNNINQNAFVEGDVKILTA